MGEVHEFVGIRVGVVPLVVVVLEGGIDVEQLPVLGRGAVALDTAAARRDNVEAALRLQARQSDLGAIVLECTNMVPYAADIRAATGLPVFSIESFVTWFQSGLTPRRYPEGLS